MCGLVGIAGDLAFKDEITMQRLLLLDVFRGQDSTGFAAVRNNGDIKIAKTAGNPLDLFNMTRFKEALRGNESKVFMGHNRAATRGGINTFNAHPFQFDHITGSHNGTLDYASVNALEDALGEKFGVDSQALIAAIAKFGVKAAIELCREGKDSLTGAWSLVWYDSVEGSLNFLRNTHRPLWYAFTKDFKKILYASEWPMIEAAAKLGIAYDLFREESSGHRFWSTEENTHYRFDVEVLKAGSDKKPKPTVRLVKGKEPLPVVATGGNTPDPFNRQTPVGGRSNVVGFQLPSSKKISGQDLGSSKTKSHSSDRIEPSIVHILGDLQSPFGGLLTKDEFDEMAKHGCSWCSADIDYGEIGVLIFERDGIILCPECSKGRDGVKSTRVYTRQNLVM